MVRYVKSITPRSAPGSLAMAGSGGATKRPLPPRRTQRWPLIGAALDPWAVTVKADPSNPGSYLAWVNEESDLLNSLAPTDYIAVSGLGETAAFTFDPGNDCIWIELPIEGSGMYLSVTGGAGTIKSYGQGDSEFVPSSSAWGSTDYVQNDGGDPPTQTFAMMMLAYSLYDGDGKPFFVQACSQHLVMRNLNIQGQAAIFPMPSPYRRYGVTS